MSLRIIREQVKTILSAIVGVGRVHDYIPVFENDTTLRDMYLFTPEGSSDPQLRGWNITRESSDEEWFGTEMNQRKYEFKLRGYLQIMDGGQSEIEFQDLVETVCETFRPKFDINETADVAEAVQAETIGHVLFAGVLCHFAEITFQVNEMKVYTTA